MIKRLNIYFKEMFPLIPRLFLGFLLFFEIYFLVILTHGVKSFNIGVPEVVGAFTVFVFLLFLRIADDFKDYETDKTNFPERALPSGKVKKKDLKIVLAILLPTMITLNILFMNNIYYFIFLMVYGILMSVWFFSRHKIQNNLFLALITHNPIQLVLNAYIISFTAIKYQIPIVTFLNVTILFALYFDGLVWEIGRKIRAPEDETVYTTYSKLIGYKKPTYFIIIIMFFDLIANIIMVSELFKFAFIGPIIGYIVFTVFAGAFIKNPKRFKMSSLIENYMYVTELFIVVLIILFLFIKA